ncbi:MAG: hypothetical protein LBR77_02725, partial [Lachnospiraceae bacterium]|nr:hypothetical protein [Lachnospiraceae bacterium]
MDDRDGQCVDIGNRYRPLVWIKGAGDLASGIGVRLHHAGFTIVMTEIAAPTTVRRTVAFSQAVYDGTCAVEGATGVLCGSVKHKAERDEFGAPSAGIAAQGVTARRFADRRFTDQDYNADGRGNDVGCADDVFADIAAVLEKKQIPVVVDPKGLTVKCLQPDVIVDAILAKRNTGTLITDAALVIGVGPGFSAGVDCHCVVETQRGHYLGRCIWKGSAIPNTGIPGEVGGYGIERLVRSPCAGVFHGTKAIGDKVEAGQAVGYVEGGG